MEKDIRPNKAELEFLTYSYNRFYDIFEEIIEDCFWRKRKINRFSKIKDGFSIYSELLNYEPIKWEIERLKKSRPPMEAEIGSELFKVVRNIILHFPYFETWDSIWISKRIVNWNKPRQSIDKFFEKYKGKEQVKYRFWEEDKKHMTYLSIVFPKTYNLDDKIFLKDILKEKEGVKFSFILMKKILDTQVAST